MHSRGLYPKCLTDGILKTPNRKTEDQARTAVNLTLRIAATPALKTVESSTQPNLFLVFNEGRQWPLTFLASLGLLRVYLCLGLAAA